MTVTDKAPEPASTPANGSVAPDTFDSLNPATGEVVGTFPIHGADAVAEAVDSAREAATWWSSLSFDTRRQHLRAWKAQIATHLDDFGELSHRENGKPVDDAVLEAVLAIDHIDWASRNARRVLGPRRISSGLLMLNQKAELEYQALGVVGVIGPWNYPIFTPMGSIAYALAAGNAVVFKPSELTPAIGQWIVDRFHDAVPEHPVLQLVTGFGETGNALCTSGVDKIAFTGSARTGRKVMAACAANLTPVLMECGGKDAMIVDRDADLDAAVDAAIWGGMSNAGQTCVGIERIYVVDEVHDEFVDRLGRQVAAVTAGEGPRADYGPMTMPSQIEVVKRHIDAAAGSGATALIGGPESVKAPFVEPVVYLDVPEDNPAVQEETFGPTLVINRVRDADEAVERANGTGYGLAAAVYAKRRGVELARRVRSGMASVNSVLAFAAIPGLPFGGVGESGFGRIHGDDGLREFSRPKAITSQRFPIPVNLMSFSRDPKSMELVKTIIRFVHGR